MEHADTVLFCLPCMQQCSALPPRRSWWQQRAIDGVIFVLLLGLFVPTAYLIAADHLATIISSTLAAVTLTWLRVGGVLSLLLAMSSLLRVFFSHALRLRYRVALFVVTLLLSPVSCLMVHTAITGYVLTQAMNKVDAHALGVACNYLAQHAREFRRSYSIHTGMTDLPRAIAEARPAFVSICDEYVCVLLRVGPPHRGWTFLPHANGCWVLFADAGGKPKIVASNVVISATATRPMP